jgi:hypothetical protein
MCKAGSWVIILGLCALTGLPLAKHYEKTRGLPRKKAIWQATGVMFGIYIFVMLLIDYVINNFL